MRSKNGSLSNLRFALENNGSGFKGITNIKKNHRSQKHFITNDRTHQKDLTETSQQIYALYKDKNPFNRKKGLLNGKKIGSKIKSKHFSTSSIAAINKNPKNLEKLNWNKNHKKGLLIKRSNSMKHKKSKTPLIKPVRTSAFDSKPKQEFIRKASHSTIHSEKKIRPKM
jgi:hypothetical protein